MSKKGLIMITKLLNYSFILALFFSAYSIGSDNTKNNKQGKAEVKPSSLTVNKKPSKTVNKINQIDLNTATLDELISIKGLGNKKSMAILSYRNEMGSFGSLAELLEVKGIGPAIYEKVTPFLKVK